MIKTPEVRQWYVTEALDSFSRLSELLPQLTEEEVLACLALEAGSRRRLSVIDRLISRAARLNEVRYVNTLKEKFRAPSLVQSDVRAIPRSEGPSEAGEG